MKLRYAFALLLTLLASRASAQFEAIPNGSFEEWGSDGNPVGWSTTNAAPTIVTVTRSNDHTDGSYSARGEAKEFAPGFGFPPLMVTGDMDKPGFPIHSRPGSLTGTIATGLNPGDAVVLTINLNKAQQGIGGNALTYTTNSASLIPFSLPIYYVTEDIPDTAIISITIVNNAGGTPAVGSFYILDGLKFAAGSSSVADHTSKPELNIASVGDELRVEFATASTGYAKIDLLDVNGRYVSTLYSGVTAGERCTSNIRSLPSGIFLCRLSTDAGVITRKVSILH